MKAATVIGGSVAEALLLWGIQQKTTAEIEAAVTCLFQAGTLKRNPGSDPETWHLPDYIAMATDLHLIRDETAAQAPLLTGFRNLIHPGRAARMGQCWRARRACLALIVRRRTPAGALSPQRALESYVGGPPC